MADSQVSRRSILLWHVHGSRTEAFVAGGRRCLIPVHPARDADDRSLGGRDRPPAQEISIQQLPEKDTDLVVLRRPHELELATRLLGRRPGIGVCAPDGRDR